MHNRAQSSAAAQIGLECRGHVELKGDRRKAPRDFFREFAAERSLAEEGRIVGFLDRLWKTISNVQSSGRFGPSADQDNARKRAQAIAPVVWLLGKTGAGKTAIVSALTGDPYAAVGEGFEPCTRTAAFYDVPPEAPLLRFLDTRGLGEAGYDPAKDIAWCEGQSHLLLVVMQVADPVQQTVLDLVRAARRRHPDWPVVAAQTGLHRLYPIGRAHPMPYPYRGGPGAAAAGAGAVPVPLVGVGGLAGIIALTLRSLASRYEVTWTNSAFAEFSGAVGGGALVWWALRYGSRELLKLIPMFGSVAAGALNAAAAFGVIVGIGEAACVWLAYRRRGLSAPDIQVRRAFADGLAAGLRYGRSQVRRHRGDDA